jgi:hypothetical protein
LISAIAVARSLAIALNVEPDDGIAMPYKPNRLLDALPDIARQAVASRLTHTELKQHHVLFDARETVTEVHFPIDAIVSLVVPLATGEAVETAMTGRDGVIGASSLPRSGPSASRGSTALSRGIS